MCWNSAIKLCLELDTSMYTVALLDIICATIFSPGAYVYAVPECAGKGTLDSVNGAKATEWLQKAEECSQDVQPFSWVLIRPPWSPHGICCKACVHLKFKELVDSGKVRMYTWSCLHGTHPIF